MGQASIIIFIIIGLYIVLSFYKGLTRKSYTQTKRKPHVSRKSLDLLEIIKSIHCYEIQIPGCSQPQHNCELLLKCINDKIGSRDESYYWTEKKIEISPSFFGFLEKEFPNQFNGKAIFDEYLNPILTFIIKNGFLESINTQYNNGFNYKYSQTSLGKKLSLQEAEKKCKDIMYEVKNYSEIYDELVFLNHKWQIRKYLQNVVSNNWLPKKYWH